MAIIENRVTEEGDVLVIKPESPIVGLISLYQFIDTTVGESLTDYFKKEFRYSVDGGLTFQSWTLLSLANIQAVSISKYNQFVIEYKYTRMGNAPEVDLAFEDILVSGTFEALPYPTYETLPFNDFFPVNDIYVFGWALNVLEKLYKKGLILPDYIDRADNNSNLEDEDFIVYWNSITHYFAILVYFARQFENFETNELLLGEFLKNKDLAFSDGNDLTDLLYIYSNYVAEYQKRGTLAIVQPKRVTGVDGELLRLINHKVYDEFVFSLMQNFESGWCLGKSSPMWKNTEGIINLSKGYEPEKNVIRLANYPLLNGAYIALTAGFMVIDGVPMNIISGIGYNAVETFKIPVDPTEDYEISFRVKQEAIVNILSFGLTAYKSDGTPVTLLNVNTSVGTNYFFQSISMKLINKEYWIRAVLWNSTKTFTGFISQPNIGVGTCLKNVSTVNYIVPTITVTNSVAITTKTYIRDLKIRPLKLNFSRGQLGVHNIIYLLMKNNNGEINDQKTKDYISDKLVSYNSFVKIKNL